MKISRRVIRSVLVPLALVALVFASSVPASAATSTTTAPTTVAVKFGPLSINW